MSNTWSTSWVSCTVPRGSQFSNIILEYNSCPFFFPYRYVNNDRTFVGINSTTFRYETMSRDLTEITLGQTRIWLHSLDIFFFLSIFYRCPSQRHVTFPNCIQLMNVWTNYLMWVIYKFIYGLYIHHTWWWYDDMVYSPRTKCNIDKLICSTSPNNRRENECKVWWAHFKSVITLNCFDRVFVLQFVLMFDVDLCLKAWATVQGLYC